MSVSVFYTVYYKCAFIYTTIMNSIVLLADEYLFDTEECVSNSSAIYLTHPFIIY